MKQIESKEPPIQSCWKTIGTMGDATCEKLAHHVHCRHCGAYSSAGRKLLDRQMTLDFAQEWSAALALPEEEKERNTFSVLLFRLRNDWLAIKTGCFAEAVSTRAIHVVPFRSGPVFRGLVNINGELLLCFSVTTLMGIEGEAPAERRQHAVYERMVVVNHGDVRFVFLVDEIDGVHHIQPDIVQKPPSTFSKSRAVFTSGIFTFRDRTVGLLDDERLLTSLQASMNA